MENRFTALAPGRLDRRLPSPTSYFVLDWGFAVADASPVLVRVSEFEFSPAHRLGAPVALGARLHPDVQFKPEPGRTTCLVEDEGGKLLCHAEITQDMGPAWQARLRSGTNVVGRARGSVSQDAAARLVEAALIALVRHALGKDA